MHTNENFYQLVFDFAANLLLQVAKTRAAKSELDSCDKGIILAANEQRYEQIFGAAPDATQLRSLLIKDCHAAEFARFFDRAAIAASQLINTTGASFATIFVSPADADVLALCAQLAPAPLSSICAQPASLMQLACNLSAAEQIASGAQTYYQKERAKVAEDCSATRACGASADDDDTDEGKIEFYGTLCIEELTAHLAEFCPELAGEYAQMAAGGILSRAQIERFGMAAVQHAGFAPDELSTNAAALEVYHTAQSELECAADITPELPQLLGLLARACVLYALGFFALNYENEYQNLAAKMLG